jgi:hypothetical protein
VYTQIPYDVAQEMDRKYDDAVYNTGTMRANTVYTATTVKIIYWRM